MTAIYRGYDQSALDAQYDQQTLVPDMARYEARNAVESLRVRNAMEGLYDIPYGPHPDERLDIFLAEPPDAPWIVYFHGGAWKALHKDTSSYVAESFAAAGVNVAVVNFSLVPTVRLVDQVDQAARSIRWLAEHARAYRGDPHRLYVLGHSSGAHLVGMMATMEWPGNSLKGAAAFSGIFDLEPVQLSWRNQYLGLTMAEAYQLSPIRRIPKIGMPLLIGYGTQELDEFQRQSREFAAAWRAHGHPCDEIVLAGLNHLEVPQSFGSPRGAVVQAVLNLLARPVFSAA